ncbi:family 43 glycosylhydrolase [Pseudonocardia nigra]|uniref:family 43 glycosylhydrolase n=1 Tax=Pseudonocardia nigra TaxID=1921578 RepID=UPI001C602039|nr:family 43 glycosylhydrolase [Pseudonocardia nigra]
MSPLRRPVVPGFHPDPSVCRVGDTYWMVCSSFEYAPGVPLFRSTDLRSWEQVGHVLDRPSQLDVSAAPGSGGITAPTLRHHDGRFWMVTTNLADGKAHLFARTCARRRRNLTGSAGAAGRCGRRGRAGLLRGSCRTRRRRAWRRWC